MKINKEQWQKMKEHYELGVPITRIAARNDLAVPTCRRYLMMDEKEYDEFAASQIPYMDSYREFIIDKLKTNPQLQNTNIYYYLKEAFSDFECPKTTFHKYMQTLRQELGGIYVRQRVTSIRKPLPPGYEAQADFGQFAMQSMYGERVRVYFFCMTMSYSRMHFVYFSAEPFTTKAAIEAHDYAFKYFGGRPQTIMYDQDRVYVVSENFGNIMLVPEFENYVKQVGYTVVLCRPRDPQTKGKVENLVKYVKQGFLEGRVFTGINALNVAALNWLDTVANAEPNDTTHKPPKEMFEEEAKALVKVPHIMIDRVEIRNVSDKYQVHFQNSIYELPHFSVAPHDQVRIEKKDGKLNFYILPYGALVYTIEEAPTGSAVPCDDASVKLETVAERELRNRLDGVDIRETFMAELEITVPRYRNAHIKKITQLVDGYGIEKVEEAMEYCISVQNCTAFELAAFIIYRYGAGTAKKLLDKNFFYSCKTRADGIARERHDRYQ